MSIIKVEAGLERGQEAGWKYLTIHVLRESWETSFTRYKNTTTHNHYNKGVGIIQNESYNTAA